MAQFTIYRSTDGSAPVLDGTVGSLVALLDACLVNGYGSKAAAGWTKPFTGTNKAAFRMGGGNQFYLRVDDNGPGAGGGKEARIRGFEAMSDVDTGTGDFPTTAQMTNGAFARKSTSADSTAREWLIAADDRTCILLTFTGDVTGISQGYYFGDIFSDILSDGFRTCLIANSGENNAGTGRLPAVSVSVTSTDAGHYIARGHLGTGTAVNVGKHTDSAKNGASTTIGGTNSLAFPNPSGGLFTAPIWVHDPTTSPANHVRGTLRGLWAPLHLASNFSSGLNGDIFAGVGPLSGRSFMILHVRNATTTGVVAIETSDTLDTN